MATRSDADRRVLILAPSGVDATVVENVLARVGLHSCICANVETLISELRAGAGAAIVAEEVIRRAEIELLSDLLATQPEWSDLPIILLAIENHDVGPLVERLCQRSNRHVSVLERPLRSSTLQAAMQAAIRSRERQYQVRDELEGRRKAERALRVSEERLRLAAEAAQFGTYDADLVRGEIHSTLETRRILGLAGDAATPLDAQALLDQIHPEDRQQVLDATAASFDPAGTGIVDTEHRIVLPGGAVRWIMVRGRTTFRKHGERRRAVRSTGTMIDITKRKQAEEKLVEADRRKDTFLAMLAHELRNPLAALRISLDVVRMAEGSPDQAAKSCQIMERQLEALVRLVDDLVDVSRVIRGKMELQIKRVELQSVLQRAVDESAVFVREAGHDLSVDLGERSIFLDADPIRLSQVFTNLLSNAAKYTPAGGHVELSVERDRDRVRVSVRDDGFGIAAADLKSIFEMFGQAHGPLERGHKGLGIGLSLARSLVEKHGGVIGAHSDGPGKGSRFDVWLPVAGGAELEAAESAARAAAPPLDAPRPVGEKSRRVLVVDDNRDAASSLAKWVEILGHETRCAFDGFEALAVAAGFRPHLVLLDIGLPEMNGYEVARRIRAQEWGEKMILAAVSGWGRDADRDEAKRAGFDRHLTKPPQPQSLRDLLEMISAPD
jgi:PAS domain S-box-containing protein